MAIKFKKLSDISYQVAFNKAFAAASEACNDYLVRYPNDWFPCGFAWVVFDGRDPAVKWLQKNKDLLGRLAGDKGYPKGWHIWDPSNSGTQCMEAKLAGAQAFVYTLLKYDIECHYESRMD